MPFGSRYASPPALIQLLDSATVGRKLNGHIAKVPLYAVTLFAMTDSLRRRVFEDHQRWIEHNPHATVGDLRWHLETALAQCKAIRDDGDPFIDGFPVTEPLASELLLSNNTGHRFSYRADCLEELLEVVAELEEKVGSNFSVRAIAV